LKNHPVKEINYKLLINYKNDEGNNGKDGNTIKQQGIE